MLQSALSSVSGSLGIVAQSSGGGGGAAALGGIIALLGIFFIIPLVIGLITVAGMWKVFAKAGQPAWAAIVPFYNTYVLVVEIADREMLWFVLSILIPFAIVVPMIDVAEKFGKGAGYGIGLFVLSFVFWPLLGFGDAEYQSRAV